MERKVLVITLVVIIILIFLGIGIGIYYVFEGFGRDSGGSSGHSSLVNPVENLTDEEAAVKFDESFVRYLLISIGAYKLHNPPLSKNTPKIEIHVDELVFNAEVRDSKIYIEKGEIGNEDVIIRTSREEGVKMMRDKKNVVDSFSSGMSSMELVSGKAVLLAKGYLKIYEELTGNKFPS